ncbi:hypothetical protein, conserved, flame shift [Thermococcus kodakarensis KOD1]|uniref:Uncharacterized protein n=1 Tax=Thermococcus kodakarensis (strain ATCC BAA-918 / JCM 12380 / KOD1) TaxID=69014 RepID=Q5JGH4_THEKO|nr:DUF1887 family protein [Thermococcus kodakarensis]WCN27217.1 DUF1887 family protein [Thermococcus kodakarensis]WCN29503.1 DUF1887 family protein [Thermococcus kodakarensis]BAD85392.1 hypothetical protein, conserved, flame shift [Thermococcus kodakarensis KOD1]
MSVHIALLGRTPWALVNTYYASVMRGERPKEVYIVTERRYSHSLPKITEAIKTISEAYGFSPEVKTLVIPDDDFKEADKVLKNLFSKLKEKDGDIVLNMTSGRKALVAAAIIHSRESNVREILYMALLDVQFPNRPYMMLPTHMQVLKNFLGDGNGG